MKQDVPELTPRQRSQISALKKLPDDQINTADIPEVLDWSNVTRGAFYRPGRKHVGRAIASTTDTSERGLESLICTALTGSAGDPPATDTARERPSSYGVGWTCGDSKDYDREYCVRPDATCGLPPRHAARGGGIAAPGPGRPNAARVPGSIARRDHQARQHRRAAQGDQARAAPNRPALRHAVAGERASQGPQSAEPLQRHPTAALQPRRDPAFPGPGPVHQRPAGRHLRAEEQPDQADGG